MSRVTAAKMRQDLRPKRLRKARAGGDGQEFPFRVAKVTSVDPKRHTVSLITLTGNGDSYDSIPITHASAGARHFLGGMPEVNDLCVVGYASSESGSSRSPFIVGWLIPGVEVGYDWMVTSPTNETDVDLTPALREALQGSFGRRRHKLRQMEVGNVLASSSQGSDLILNESATITNRRGNEVTLRDQDQALVTRTLQKFHAGAGVREYSGMVQRDATFAPSQMFRDSMKWDANRQVDPQGKALYSDQLEEELQPGTIQVHAVFDDPNLAMGATDPREILQRGLFIGEDGQPFDGRVQPSAVYGGKPIYRVAVDASNGVLDPGTNVFTEWRIEVAHTSDGTLPVTEQTDGIDIDRLLASVPTGGVDGSGDSNPLNQSPNAAMTSMVMGTAIGNDPIGDRDSYGLPLIARIIGDSGEFSPGIQAAQAGTPISEHSAFLLRVKNPSDPKAPEAFMAITKGGTFRTYFPGGHEEFYKGGKRIRLGSGAEGKSYTVEGDGRVSLHNTGKGGPADNVGVSVRSEGGSVHIYGGGSESQGSGTPSTNPNLTPSGFGSAVTIESAKSMKLSAVKTLKITGQAVRIQDTDSLRVDANSTIDMNSGESLSQNTKCFSLVTGGRAEFIHGGPKNAQTTNGPLRRTSFNGTPATGVTGGVVDEYEVKYGGRSEVFQNGRHDTTVESGSFNITTGKTAFQTASRGSGIHLVVGDRGSQLDLNPSGATLRASQGNLTMQATIGKAEITGSTGVILRSDASIGMNAPSVTVTVPTPWTGGVITDGCIDPLTGRPYALSGTLGLATFRVG